MNNPEINTPFFDKELRVFLEETNNNDILKKWDSIKAKYKNNRDVG